MLSRIPNSPELKTKWLSAIRSANNDYDIDSNFIKGFICSQHFLPEYVKQSGDRISLKPNSVPSIFDFMIETIDINSIHPACEVSDLQQNSSSLGAQVENIKNNELVNKLKNELKCSKEVVAALKQKVTRLEKELKSSEKCSKMYLQKILMYGSNSDELYVGCHILPINFNFNTIRY